MSDRPQPEQPASVWATETRERFGYAPERCCATCGMPVGLATVNEYGPFACPQCGPYVETEARRQSVKCGQCGCVFSLERARNAAMFWAAVEALLRRALAVEAGEPRPNPRVGRVERGVCGDEVVEERFRP